MGESEKWIILLNPKVDCSDCIEDIMKRNNFLQTEEEGLVIIEVFDFL